jgi:hypothetical protein
MARGKNRALIASTHRTRTSTDAAHSQAKSHVKPLYRKHIEIRKRQESFCNSITPRNTHCTMASTQSARLPSTVPDEQQQNNKNARVLGRRWTSLSDDGGKKSRSTTDAAQKTNNETPVRKIMTMMNIPPKITTMIPPLVGPYAP